MDLHSRRARRIAAAIFAVGVLASALLGMRTYGSYLFLRSAQEAGAPATSVIHGRMLLSGLALPSATDTHASLKSLAEGMGASPLDFVRRVQKTVASAISRASSATGTNGPERPGTLGDESLAAVLRYGYYALGLTVLGGSIGLIELLRRGILGRTVAG